MDKRIIDFLSKNKISVLTTLLSDGTPHSASMHFANDDRLNFVFFTKAKSRKCSHFVEGKKYPASLVIGFSEEEWVEFQAEGFIQKIAKTNSKPEEKVFAGKFDGAKLDSEHMVLKYKATWWRYTEFKPKFFKLESK